MFERYTERARQVIVLSQQEARKYIHNYVGTEHLLAGLVREEEGLAARVLYSLGITAEYVDEQINRLVGRGDEAPLGQIPFTARAQKSLELALREALSLGHNYIGTEHILLGLVRENAGTASSMLLEKAVTPEVVRDEIIRMLSGPNRQKRDASTPAQPSADWAKVTKPMVEQLRSMIENLTGEKDPVSPEAESTAILVKLDPALLELAQEARRYLYFLRTQEQPDF